MSNVTQGVQDALLERDPLSRSEAPSEAPDAWEESPQRRMLKRIERYFWGAALLAVGIFYLLKLVGPLEGAAEGVLWSGLLIAGGVWLLAVAYVRNLFGDHPTGS